jgi:putative ABC transport system permease protein
MSLFKIAWRSIQQRWLASALTMISMALGVMLVVGVLLLMGIVTESFRSNSSLGYNMIVGANGGDLQMTLNTVYYLSKPVENIPYTYYLDFKGPEMRPDGQLGKFAQYAEFAIPLCLGDYYKEYRVIGTTPELFDDFEYDAELGRKYEMSQGRNFKLKTAEHGYFEAVVGAKVAQDTGLQVGDSFTPTHGTPEGESHDEFFVVGVLKRSGTPNDRAVFVNMEGFFLLEGHAKIEEQDQEEITEPPTVAADNRPLLPNLVKFVSIPYDPAVCQVDERRFRLKPLPLEQREVTSILLRTSAPYMAPGLKRTINKGKLARAVTPISEIYQLFKTIVDPIKWTLLLLTIMICIVSGVSILVSIYNSMSDRRHEIAVIRSLGAGRKTVMTIVLLESVLLALGGGLLGWIGGHALVGLVARPFVEDQTGVSIGVLDLAPQVKPFALLGNSPIMDWGISSEFLLIPGLILLAIIVGFLPAVAAYRTDVAKSLSASG